MLLVDITNTIYSSCGSLFVTLDSLTSILDPLLTTFWTPLELSRLGKDRYYALELGGIDRA